jgi:hypothetical protein
MAMPQTKTTIEMPSPISLIQTSGRPICVIFRDEALMKMCG